MKTNKKILKMVKEILRKSQMKSGVSLKTRVIKDKTA